MNLHVFRSVLIISFTIDDNYKVQPLLIVHIVPRKTLLKLFSTLHIMLKRCLMILRQLSRSRYSELKEQAYISLKRSALKCHTIDICTEHRGGDIGGTGGDVPPKIRGGDGPCIRPLPNILRSSVKKGVIKEFFSEIVVYLVKKGSYTTFNTGKIRKIRKTWSMTKKGHQKFFGVKMEIFSEKRHSEILVREKFVPSPRLSRKISQVTLFRVTFDLKRGRP